MDNNKSSYRKYLTLTHPPIHHNPPYIQISPTSDNICQSKYLRLGNETIDAARKPPKRPPRWFSSSIYCFITKTQIFTLANIITRRTDLYIWWIMVDWWMSQR